MELQKNVKHGELSFLEKDVRNLFSRVKRELDMDDIKNLFEHMKLAKQESPLFQYAYTIDNENKLENLFWCRAQSFDCYQKYGDVVVFDTTYKVNSYNMPCGIFVGIDNHGKTILFGCALLRNETTSTFKWLMKVDIGVEEIIQGHAHLSLNALIKPTSLKTKSPLEEQVFGVFTPFAFKKFQDELTRATLYSIIHVEGHEFTVRYYEGDDKISHRVFWDGKNTAMCSCKIFEFWGILCRHILRVLFHKDCFKIPLSYLPLRWCCDALQDTTSTQEDALQANISTQEVVQEEMFSVEELTPTINASMGDVLCPPQSKTKGRPKKKREKGGKEVAKKKTKSCSICKQPGHTKPTCPYKENILPHKLQMMVMFS
uniref:Protein FAR1-RELATED SEQUENCE n=1 Tax=Chenopodium quinoa TaxID=63459 RepID=A0A803N035_CHEQI